MAAAAAPSGYESVLCVKPDVKVYRLPPRQSNRAVRAADWQLESPDWCGRLRIVVVDKRLWLRLEDKTSGDLFARCPVDAFPGVAIEPVADSSRYFVIRVQDDSGRAAFIGIGFDDRGDAFDFNVAVQDHFKGLKQEAEAEQAAKEMAEGPKLDLSLKEGQTFRIAINTGRGGGESGSGGSRSRPKPAGGGAGGILLPPPPAPGSRHGQVKPSTNSDQVGLAKQQGGGGGLGWDTFQ
ncbi:hypothetical protein BOX15_Mlig022187g1 [Macrostomum lignano]|uniref:Uncharacterized protein n=2 Tax=Macrostomum lignano TaxID=282301 RepID=A0A267H6N6_9PLAT|nr:hypothetical protein BOX15_Mlig022187g1 [Macrostomum lignano]